MNRELEFRWTIPDNWVWTSLSKIGEVVAGGTPSTKEPTYWANEINWISPSDLTGYSSKTIKNLIPYYVHPRPRNAARQSGRLACEPIPPQF